ncbi:MAG: hypothetical protein IPG50_17815 [Myxococcales bacterium]|nr:hypothetical protein [Myxococcales bacterium]
MSKRSRLGLASLMVLSAVWPAACSSTESPAGGDDDAGAVAPGRDSSVESDGGGTSTSDGATALDATTIDAPPGDATTADAAPGDATTTDAAPGDASSDASVDATLDAGVDAAFDASTVDASDASSLPDAKADASDASSVDAAAAGPLLVACGTGKFEIGEYGTWGGKVNVHRNWGGTWSVDTDCSSGNTNNTVAYCQKFWPAASSQAAVAVSGNKPFTAGGGTAPTCGGVYNEPGQTQAACCVANPCADGFVPVGTYSTWSGKVNVHRAVNGAWEVDSDCSSGANVNTVSYCQKFWPASTSQVAVTVEAGNKPFTAGGGSAPTCGGAYPGVGQVQYACCAPR